MSTFSSVNVFMSQFFKGQWSVGYFFWESDDVIDSIYIVGEEQHFRNLNFLVKNFESQNCTLGSNLSNS